MSKTLAKPFVVVSCLLALFQTQDLMACAAEAQYIGRVVSSRTVGIDQYAVDCLYKARMTYFRPTQECFYQADAEAVEFFDAACVIPVGAEVSGVLIKNGSTISVD